MENLTSASTPAGICQANEKECQVPTCFREVVEVRGSSLDRKLGYFRNAQFAVFSFHPMASEDIWNDARSSGFGGGGWRVFLDECLPAALRVGAELGSQNGIGSEVLFVGSSVIGSQQGKSLCCRQEVRRGVSRSNPRPTTCAPSVPVCHEAAAVQGGIQCLIRSST